MIVFRGGRGSGIGLPSLITPTKNFAQVRQDKQRELQMVAMMADQEKMKRVELQQQIAEQRQKYDQIKALSFLAPDQNRVNVIADTLEEKIKEKVKLKYGGNIKKYIEEGGADSDFDMFVSSLKNSEAYQKATSNKINMATYLEDQKSGKVPMMVNGRSVRDIYTGFMTGREPEFNYQGAYTAPKDYAKRIQDSYGTDRFTKEAASPSRVILELQQDGLTLQQAIDYYQQSGLDRNPIFFKTDDAYEKKKMEEESLLRQARINKLNEPDATKSTEGNMSVRDALMQVGGPTVERDWNQSKANFSISGPLSKPEASMAMNYINGAYDEKTGYYTLPKGSQLKTSDGTTLLSGISHVYNPRIVVKRNGLNPAQDELFLQVDGMMTEDAAQSAGSRISNGKKSSVESFMTNDDVIGGSALVKKPNWIQEIFGLGNDENGFKYEVKDLLVPINPNTKFGEAIINKQANVGPKNYNPAELLYDE